LVLLAIRRSEVTTDTRKKLAYFVGSSFLGHIVPSRRSGTRLALELPARLLELAEKEGIATDVPRLGIDDFLPGTVGTYSNPYHYYLTGWKTSGTGLGQRLS
jgi:hypothetical protein